MLADVEPGFFSPELVFKVAEDQNVELVDQNVTYSCFSLI